MLAVFMLAVTMRSMMPPASQTLLLSVFHHCVDRCCDGDGESERHADQTRERSYTYNRIELIGEGPDHEPKHAHAYADHKREGSS